MKKIIFVITIFIFNLSISNAASCIVISGDGINIGDEIKCDTEYFYVLSNNDEEVRMLAKYNLMVGRTLHKIEFEQNFENYSSARDYYFENYENQYDGFINLTINEDNLYNGAIAYDVIEYNQVIQGSKAIGAHGDQKGNPLFPEVGITMWESGIEADIENAFTNGTKTYGGGNFIDFQLNNDSSNLIFLNKYKDYLKNISIETKNLSILTINDINNIVFELTNEEIPLEEWNKNAKLINTNEGKKYYVLGNLKDLLSEEYSWLWSTTYWTNTSTAEQKANGTGKRYFIDTLGYLCSEQSCGSAIGAGVRPVVTISVEEIKYEVKTKTDGNGQVESNSTEAKEGDKITFIATPNEGYKIKEIKVTDANDNVVIFTNNTFTMPASTVTIEAIFEKEVINPNTFSRNIIIYLFIMLISFVLIVIQNKKMKWTTT